METTENQRLKILRQELNLTQAALAAKLNIKQGSYADVERGKVKVSGGIKLLLNKDFSININWLETGEGNMFYQKEEAEVMETRGTSHEAVAEHHLPAVSGSPNSSSVPIYDIDFSAGTLINLIELRNEYGPIGWLDWPEVRGCDAIIRVTGDSMEDRIKEGSWIAIKQQPDWYEWLPENQIYAISTETHLLVKYITENHKDYFLTESHNSFYKPRRIPKKYIKDLWAVKVVLPFNQIKIL